MAKNSSTGPIYNLSLFNAEPVLPDDFHLLFMKKIMFVQVKTKKFNQQIFALPTVNTAPSSNIMHKYSQKFIYLLQISAEIEKNS